MQSDANPAVAAGIGGVMLMCWLAIALIFIVGLWKVFVKAGQPGWAILVPFYNIYILMKIAGKPDRSDGRPQHGEGLRPQPAFGIVMLFLLSGIGYLIPGFGSDRYLGPPAAA